MAGEAELTQLQAELAEIRAEQKELKENQAKLLEEKKKLRNQCYGEDALTKKKDALEAALRKRFSKFSGADGRMDHKEFCAALGLKEGKDDQTLGSKIFNSMEPEGGKYITEPQFTSTIVKLNTGSFNERSEVAFQMFDSDNNHRVDEEEFFAFLKCSLLEARLNTQDHDVEGEKHLHDVVKQIFEEEKRKDPSIVEAGGITLTQFQDIMEKSKLQGVKLSGMEAPSRAEQTRETFKIPDVGRVRQFFINEFKRIFLFLLIASLSSWAFEYKWQEYNNGPKFELMGYSLPLAKGCAEIMKVTILFLMIFMCRSFITLWRGSWIGKYLIEFDDAVMIHICCAKVFGVAMWVHVFAHVVNAERITDPNNYDKWCTAYEDDCIQDGVKQDQWTRTDFYTQNTQVTGILLTLGFSIVYAFALKWPRELEFIKKSKIGKCWNDFNMFWLTHHIVFICFVLLIIHPWPGLCWDPCDADSLGGLHGDTWQWVILPFSIYGAERLRRAWKAFHNEFSPMVLNGTKLKHTDSDPKRDQPVLQLQMSKPSSWDDMGPKKVEAGMYCFIQCPSISGYEWHPFTLTSAPHEDMVEVHVRGLGDWTKELCKRFGEVEKQREIEDARSEDEPLVPLAYPKMNLEGPYGAPAQGYDRFKVLLLVGSGIGVTPFLSILKDIHHQMDMKRCWKCQHVNQNGFPLEKVYFNYISRDQASMSWFTDVLTPIVMDDERNVIEIHQHLTSVRAGEDDIRTAAIKMAQNTSIRQGQETTDGKSFHDSIRESKKLAQSSGQEYNEMEHGFKGRDILTGSLAKTPVHFGRPNWDKIFSYIKKQHKLSEVGVFYCGPPVIGAQLEAASSKYSDLNGTKFFYYEEHF